MAATVRVQLGARSYDVQIGDGCLTDLGKFAGQWSPRTTRSVVIADETVTRLYGPQVMDSLAKAGLAGQLLEFPSGEASKTIGVYADLMDRLLTLAPAIDRSCLIVALGGGVTGDMAGFVAATALRGLSWVQCPTTLLAAVDASVGGKTGLDHASGKNLIGAFHQPRGVFIDVQTLRTLPPEQLANGLAECVKHAVIRDASLLDFLEKHAADILACQGPILVHLIARNVAIKAAVVSADERETGQRAHLNLGHTIGHAIETVLGYGRIGHGQAVSLGMLAACHMAAGRGLLDADACRRVKRLLAHLGLPVRLADLPCDNPRPEETGAVLSPPGASALDGAVIWRIMQHDKKAQGGRVRMVLPTSLGSAAVFDDITEAQVCGALAALQG